VQSRAVLVVVGVVVVVVVVVVVAVVGSVVGSVAAVTGVDWPNLAYKASATATQSGSMCVSLLRS
jgi:hypothetical protein